MTNTTVKESQRLELFVTAIFKGLWIFIKTTAKGAARKSLWTKDALLAWGMYSLAAALLTYSPKWTPPYMLYRFGGFPFFKYLGVWIHENISRPMQLMFIPLPMVLMCFVIGILELMKKSKIEKAIRHLGLKTSTGLEPRVLAVNRINENKSKILVHAEGLDINDFLSKKGALESGLNKIVQEIKVSPQSRQVFEIMVSNKELPRMIRFDSVSELLSKPYNFLVGEATSGFLSGDLRELHHMLIAGSTGGGKSVFFKQTLIGLLKSSRYVHLYLIDLKRGVEMSMFEVLPNVYVAKSVVEAIASLQAIEKEMNRRFEYLEQKGFTEIDPERDMLDRLIVGVDEASVLFTVDKNSKINKDLANEARTLTDNLTKLGRAAGIHVILATQKVTKETIDTRVQTNIHAKICFRVNTIASSMTVLGNKKAAELPEIKGRAIWSVGSKDMEVQVPFLSHEEAKEEVDHLSRKFDCAESKTFQPLLFSPDVELKNDNGGKSTLINSKKRVK